MVISKKSVLKLHYVKYMFEYTFHEDYILMKEIIALTIKKHYIHGLLVNPVVISDSLAQ